jgi:pyruvate-formate lyase-activating enzyme
MLGNLNDLSIETILNGPKLKEIRESLRQGQSHPYCVNCVQRESVNGASERSWHNSINEGFDTTQAGLDYEFPTLIDIRWNSTCNLSCNYCGTGDSSKWAVLKGVPVFNNTRRYYQEVCDFIEKHTDHIQEVALVGGEPLLLPENERLLDVIPKDCVVTLITNLNNPLENNRIFKKLVDRQRVGWSMSFDNIGQQFEYVRHGGSWSVLQENLKVIKDLMRTQGHWGGIHAVYNIYNATRLKEFRQFAEDSNITVLWQNLFQPEHLDPFLHGPAVAKLAAAEIEKFYALNIATPAEQKFFDKALSKYDSICTAQPGIVEKFKNHINDIETLYHPDTAGKFEQLWPELAESMK